MSEAHDPLAVAIADTRGRPLRDLRISVTDRCNFRCSYCMPKELFGLNHRFMPRRELLSFEELQRTVAIFASLGVRKIRLTGGEPLLRQDLHLLIRMIADTPGIEDVSLTTNGSLLTLGAATRLADAGLRRVTVSLDALREDVFQAMNDVSFPASRVLEAIDNATRAGLSPVKINCVVKRGVNDTEILPIVERFRGSGHILRFIEFMDVGSTNGWRLDDVVPASEILDTVGARFPLSPVEPNYRGEVARRWTFDDGAGEIGVIASVSQPFCGACSRARLSAEGRLYTCLFATDGFDVRRLLRSGASDEYLTAALGGLWRRRDDRYSELRTRQTPSSPKIEMSYIGG